jgi:hypothetical protein
MEDNIGFRKKPRLEASHGAALQVVDNPGGSRPGGKAGGQKSGAKQQASHANTVGMKVVSGSRGKKQGPDVADHISRQLKAIYDDVLGQPVPSRFHDLLSKLGNDRDE